MRRTVRNDVATQFYRSRPAEIEEKDKPGRLDKWPDRSKLTHTPRQHIINVSLQVAGIAAAGAFGAFAVQSVRLSKDANHLAAIAVNQSIAQNRMAMYSICVSSQLQVS